jgi:hypothetical protein
MIKKLTIHKLGSRGSPRFDVIKDISRVEIDYGFEHMETEKFYTAIHIFGDKTYCLYDVADPKALYDNLKKSLAKRTKEVVLDVSIFDFDRPEHDNNPSGYTLDLYLSSLDMEFFINTPAFKVFTTTEKMSILKGAYRPIHIRNKVFLARWWRKTLPIPVEVRKTKIKFFYEILDINHSC